MHDPLLDKRRAYMGEANPIIKMAHGEEYAALLEKRLEAPNEANDGTEGSESAGYDQVRVTFTDGSSTLLNVPEDEDIQSALVRLCEESGYDIESVDGYSIVTGK